MKGAGSAFSWRLLDSQRSCAGWSGIDMFSRDYLTKPEPGSLAVITPHTRLGSRTFSLF